MSSCGLAKIRISARRLVIMMIIVMTGTVIICLSSNSVRSPALHTSPPPYLSQQERHQILGRHVKPSNKTLRFVEWVKSEPQYAINAPNRCDSQTRLLIVMNSRPHDLKTRQIVRSTWAKPVYDGSHPWIKLVFFWGRPSNSTYDKELLEENAKYGDTVTDVTFQDSYNNVSYLALARFKWIDRHCPHAQAIYKVDTDNWINFDRFLARYSQIKGKIGVHGFVYMGGAPHHEPNHFWSVPYDDYPFDDFPLFVCGCGYFIINYQDSRANQETIVQRILYVARHTEVYVWIDDVFITGVLRAAAGISLYALPDRIHEGGRYEPIEACNYAEFLSLHHLKPHELQRLNKQFNDAQYMASCSSTQLLLQRFWYYLFPTRYW